MKAPLILLLTLIGGLAATAQDSIFLNRNFRDTTAQNASYYRIRIRKDAGWQVADHYLNGKIQMTGTYSDDSCHVQEGDFTWFDSTGLVIHRCAYSGGKENGVETYLYTNGQVNTTGTNKGGKKEGEWTGYYLNGKISGKAVYSNGKEVSGTFYNEDGVPNTKVTEFVRESAYPGGIQAWARFLSQNLQYPDRAVRKKIQGIVIVQFVVSKEGKQEDIQVIQSVNKDLDAEALRVIRLADTWIPAIQGGRLVKSYKRQPVVFKLQAP